MKLRETSVVALFAATLAACGGSDSSEGTPAASSTTEAVETTTAAVEEVATETAETVAEAATDSTATAEETAEAIVETGADAAQSAAEAVAEGAEETVAAAAAAADEVVETVEAQAGEAQTYEVQMLNADPNDRSQRMVFEPAILSVQPGDTVTWVPTDLTHLAASTRGMLPEGVEGWQGRVNQPVSYTFEKPGIYGYNCTPHQAAGMVGLVVVEGEGKLDNLEAAKAVRQPGLASRRWDAIWADAEAQGLLSE